MTKARARVSTRVKARAKGGTRATVAKERAITAREVGHKRAECWKCWKDHQNQIRAVDEQEEEAIEQVECQTCWDGGGQVDEVIPPPGQGRWHVALILRGC